MCVCGLFLLIWCKCYTFHLISCVQEEKEGEAGFGYGILSLGLQAIVRTL